MCHTLIFVDQKKTYIFLTFFGMLFIYTLPSTQTILRGGGGPPPRKYIDLEPPAFVGLNSPKTSQQSVWKPYRPLLLFNISLRR